MRRVSPPNAEFDFTDVYPDQPVLRGIEEMRRPRRRSVGRVHPFRAGELLCVDDERALVFVRSTSTGQTSGVAVESSVAHEITIRDGLIVRIKVYRDRGKVLEAVGLAG
jgi:ketosteroid isomerase-like protein